MLRYEVLVPKDTKLLKTFPEPPKISLELFVRKTGTGASGEILLTLPKT